MNGFIDPTLQRQFNAQSEQFETLYFHEHFSTHFCYDIAEFLDVQIDVSLDFLGPTVLVCWVAENRVENFVDESRKVLNSIRQHVPDDECLRVKECEQKSFRFLLDNLRAWCFLQSTRPAILWYNSKLWTSMSEGSCWRPWLLHLGLWQSISVTASGHWDNPEWSSAKKRAVSLHQRF